MLHYTAFCHKKSMETRKKNRYKSGNKIISQAQLITNSLNYFPEMMSNNDQIKNFFGFFL